MDSGLEIQAALSVTIQNQKNFHMYFFHDDRFYLKEYYNFLMKHPVFSKNFCMEIITSSKKKCKDLQISGLKAALFCT
jgi:hypothetical protein